MVTIETNSVTFMEFLDSVVCHGIMNVDNEKVKQGTLFTNFLAKVESGVMLITATDTKSNKIIAQHIYKALVNVSAKDDKVDEIPITNAQDFITAITRAGVAKDSTIIIKYPDEENKIRVQRKGSKTAFRFETKGKGDITSLNNTNMIVHKWDSTRKQVISDNPATGNHLEWKHKIICLPDDLAEVALDMKDFVKQKIVHVSITDKEMLFSLGLANSTKKGDREIVGISRWMMMGKFDADKKPIVGKDGKQIVEWGPITAMDGIETIEANYFHGFYSILQNLPRKQPLELHFDKMGGGYPCWIRSFSDRMELNYMVPYDTGTK